MSAVEAHQGVQPGQVWDTWAVSGPGAPQSRIVAPGTRSASLEHVTALNLPANPEKGFMRHWVSFTCKDPGAQAGESHGPGSLSEVKEQGFISGRQIPDSRAELLTTLIRCDRLTGPTQRGDPGHSYSESLDRILNSQLPLVKGVTL